MRTTREQFIVNPFLDQLLSTEATSQSVGNPERQLKIFKKEKFLENFRDSSFDQEKSYHVAVNEAASLIRTRAQMRSLLRGSVIRDLSHQRAVEKFLLQVGNQSWTLSKCAVELIFVMRSYWDLLLIFIYNFYELFETYNAYKF